MPNLICFRLSWYVLEPNALFLIIIVVFSYIDKQIQYTSRIFRRNWDQLRKMLSVRIVLTTPWFYCDALPTEPRRLLLRTCRKFWLSSYSTRGALERERKIPPARKNTFNPRCTILVLYIRSMDGTRCSEAVVNLITVWDIIWIDTKAWIDKTIMRFYKLQYVFYVMFKTRTAVFYQV